MKKIFLVIILLIPFVLVPGQTPYWEEKTSMRYPVSGGQVVFNNSRIEPKFYILGGYSDSLQKAVDWIQEYDLIKNTWKIVGNMNTARKNFTSSIWDSSIVYCGGAEEYSKFENGISLWNIYSANNPSVLDSSFEFNRSRATAHVYNDLFYLIGGNSLDVQNSVSYIFEYDLVNKTFVYNDNSSNASANNPEDQMTFLVDGNIYILGGSYNGVLNGIKKFSTNNKELKELSQTLSTPRAGGAAIYNNKLKKAFLIGGYSESEIALQSVSEINFKSDGSLIISQAPSLNYARKNPMVVNYYHFIIVFGGTDASGKVVSKVEQYFDPTVIGGNNPPSFNSIDIPQPIRPDVEFTYRFSATDPDGDALTFTLEEGPIGSTISKSGLFKWTPTFDQAQQTFLISVKVSDGLLSQSYTGNITTDSMVTPVDTEDGSLPTITTLFQNYPNPFNPTTSISYSLSNSSYVVLTVYNILGQEIQKLVDSYQTAGNHAVTFNAENMHSGVYFYKIAANDFVDVKRMLLLK